MDTTSTRRVEGCEFVSCTCSKLKPIFFFKFSRRKNVAPLTIFVKEIFSTFLLTMLSSVGQFSIISFCRPLNRVAQITYISIEFYCGRQFYFLVKSKLAALFHIFGLFRLCCVLGVIKLVNATGVEKPVKNP